MLHGRLIVDPADGATAAGAGGGTAHDDTAGGPGGSETAHGGAATPASKPSVPRDRETARAVGVGPMVERQLACGADGILMGMMGSGGMMAAS